MNAHRSIITGFALLAVVMHISACSGEKRKATLPLKLGEKKTMSYNKLTKDEEYVILKKGTERPFIGKYNDHDEKGVYTCRRCDAMLYQSDDKFKSGCGWPSFDDEIPGAVRRERDADGRRVEILCANCDGHLGHVFEGEHLTKKNVRHCVNSVSLGFIPAAEVTYGKATFAGGCFWGVEYFLQQVPGVIATQVGYIGGSKDNPTYREICNKTTGHAEAVQVSYDPARVDFETLAKVFFETHDPTQVDRQGPDIGDQYRSEVFVHDAEQRKTTEKLISILKKKGMKVATKVTDATKFWSGEDYHQDYYKKKGTLPYCHAYQKRF